MADIKISTDYVLKIEDARLSGVVTTDRGGKTRFGVAQRYHPTLDPRFYTCPREEALAWAEQLYGSEYAAPLHLDKIENQFLANKLLDISINANPLRSAKFAQTALCDLGTHVEIDGVLGTASVAALNGADQPKLMARIIVLLENFYREDAIRLNAPDYELRSWLSRAARPGV